MRVYLNTKAALSKRLLVSAVKYLKAYTSSAAGTRAFMALLLATAFIVTIATPFLYAEIARVRDWCYVPYTETTRGILREVAVLGTLIAMICVFLGATILSLLNSRNIAANVAVFLCAYLVVVSAFAMYFYTFGITVTPVGAKNLELDSGSIVSNMSDYMYFSLTNSIFMTPTEFESCPSLRAAIVVQRVSSLIVAFGAGLVGSRITKLIE
ncbi:hypothetical protein [Rhizobium sp. SAFR-030]|uniref:hypothetical protein n=1 Tax=Rhizobium sp. SAFR-030 TaxID=3387277 RepID=UPI003F81CFEA